MTAYLVTVRSLHDPTAPDHLFLIDGDLDGGTVARLTTDLALRSGGATGFLDAGR